jgi:restriction system protein
MPPRRRSKRKNDPWVSAAVLVGFLIVVWGVATFWDALANGNPLAIGVMVAIFLALVGATAFYVYRFLMRRERRFAARRLAEQQALDEQRAEEEYLRWLRTADIEALDRMAGIEFEHALEQLFLDLGYGTLVTQASHDYGADLVLSRGGQKIVVQAKRYVGVLGLDAVQQASAARLHYGAVRAIVVTTSDFTSPARALAQSTGVELWNRQRLNEELASVAERRNLRPGFDGGAGPESDDHRLDPLFARSARMVAAQGDASVSLVQRIFNVDYSRASRIVDELVDHGVIGAFQGSKSRNVLMTLPDVDDLLERLGIE